MQIVLDRGQRADWFASSWVVWTTLARVAAALLILAINELRIADPILDLRILKIKVFSVGLVLIVAMSSVLYGTELLMPIFLQEFMGYTAWKAGLVLAPRGLGDDAVDAGGRTDRAPRFRHPSAGRSGLHPDDGRLVDDVRLGSPGQPVGVSLSRAS